MFRVSPHPSSGVLKTVTAAAGTSHNIGTATSFQRGLVAGHVGRHRTNNSYSIAAGRYYEYKQLCAICSQGPVALPAMNSVFLSHVKYEAAHLLLLDIERPGHVGGK